jgi:hypothetical protein
MFGSATKARNHEKPQRLSFVFSCLRGGSILLLVALVIVSTVLVEAHKPITSKYTYNDDVFPILRDRCARCHVQGGVAPMSLMTYEEAFPWAESIRTELIAGHMPPAQPDEAFGELKGAHTLSPKQIDVILTWASGGNPRGALDQKLPTVTLKNEWIGGAPDITLQLPEFAFAADKMDDTKEFTIPSGTKEPRWVRAVDLLPGTPSIVRSAIVFVKGAETANGLSPERILARWVPGHDPEPIASGIAYRLPAGAELGVRIHYKKTWQFEGKPLSDRSSIGVYFAPAPNAQELLTLPVAAPAQTAPPADQKVTFSQTIADDVQALALSPDEVPPNITVQVQAVRADGSRTPMIRLNTRPDWDRRYWFDKPIALPRGSTIEVTAILQDPDLLSNAFALPTASPPPAPKPTAFRFALNVVPARATPAAP